MGSRPSRPQRSERSLNSKGSRHPERSRLSDRSLTGAAHLSRLGLLAAAAVAAYVFESLLPSPVPWARIGLSNVFVVTALFAFGTSDAFLVNLVRVIAGNLLMGFIFSPAFVFVSETIGKPSLAGSGSVMLAEAQMKSSRIINSEKMASCTPAAPSECPESDLVELMSGMLSPNTVRIASSSRMSPTGVLVPCALM